MKSAPVGHVARALVARAIAVLGPEPEHLDAALDRAVEFARRSPRRDVLPYLQAHREQIRRELTDAQVLGWSVEFTFPEGKPTTSTSVSLHPSANFLPEFVAIPVMLATALIVAVDAVETETLPPVGLGAPRNRRILPPPPRPRVHWRSGRARLPDLGGDRDVLMATVRDLVVASVLFVGDRETCMHLLTALCLALRDGHARPTIGSDGGRYEGVLSSLMAPGAA